MRLRSSLRPVILVVLAAVGLTLLVTSPLPSSRVSMLVGGWLMDPLKRRFELHSLESMETYTGLIVLGGSHERVHEAGRIARANPHLRVFVSGSGTPDHVLRLLGDDIAAERLEIDTLPNTTYENARYAARFLLPSSEQRWLLVTSDFHMPRAVGSFRRFGFNVTPWPVDDMPADYPRKFRTARHEWLGLATYWLLGRSTALFPAPHS